MQAPKASPLSLPCHTLAPDTAAERCGQRTVAALTKGWTSPRLRAMCGCEHHTFMLKPKMRLQGDGRAQLLGISALERSPTELPARP
jgi:hypothetical protein